MVFGISKDMFELGKRMIREESNLGREKFATLEEDRGNNFNLDSSINGSRQCVRNNGRETDQLLATFDNLDT